VSVKSAQQWLKSHSPSLPALQIFHRQATLRGRKGAQSANLVLAIGQDPGLSLAMLQRVNRQRGPDSERDPIESYAAGLALLGEPATLNLVRRHPVAESLLQDSDQLDSYHRIINRCLLNEFQVVYWARVAGYQQLEPIRLAARLAYVGEALCCAHDHAYYQRLNSSGAETGGETDFSFDQLSIALCKAFHLPELVLQSLSARDDAGQRSRLVRLLARFSKDCEQNWFSDALLKSSEGLAAMLQQPTDTVQRQLRLNAIEAARQSPLAQTWQAAAGLVQVWSPQAGNESADNVQPTPQPVAVAPAQTLQPAPDGSDSTETVDVAAAQPRTDIQSTETQQVDPPPPLAASACATEPEPAPGSDAQPVIEPAPPSPPARQPALDGASARPRRSAAPQVQSAAERIKALARDPDVSQTKVIRACIDGLISDIPLDRVCLLLLSRDKQKLQNRMNAGVDAGSPLRQFEVTVATGGLFKVLLNKPQALWLNPDNYEKYQKLVPDDFMACILNEDFFTMSLFIEDKPVGVMFGDARVKGEPLSKKRFIRFKQLVMLCSKALTLHTRLQAG
jgi:hypothetical protein